MWIQVVRTADIRSCRAHDNTRSESQLDLQLIIQLSWLYMSTWLYQAPWSSEINCRSTQSFSVIHSHRNSSHGILCGMKLKDCYIDSLSSYVLSQTLSLLKCVWPRVSRASKTTVSRMKKGHSQCGFEEHWTTLIHMAWTEVKCYQKVDRRRNCTVFKFVGFTLLQYKPGGYETAGCWADERQ